MRKQLQIGRNYCPEPTNLHLTDEGGLARAVRSQKKKLEPFVITSRGSGGLGFTKTYYHIIRHVNFLCLI